MTMTRRLPVTLSQDAKFDRAMKMAKKMEEIEDIKKERDASNAEYNGQIKRLNLEMAQLAESINIGFEDQDVEVQEERDYANKVVRIMRTDVKEGQQVDVRPMTEAEMGELQVDAFKDKPADGEPTNATEAVEKVRKDIEG